MAHLTLRAVNAAIKKEGGKEILVRGNGYFYFAEGEAHMWYSDSIYTMYLNDMPLERWVDEWRMRRDDYRELLKQRGISETETQRVVDSEKPQDDAGSSESGERGERESAAPAQVGAEVSDGARAGRGVAAMSKYGQMPPRPDIRAKVRGDAGTYTVWGFDWMNHRVVLDRAGLEWVDIAKVQILDSAPEPEPANADTARLDFMMEHGAIVERLGGKCRVGTRFGPLSDWVDSPREAIDAAMKAKEPEGAPK
jgi:hypothetical protein